MGVDLLRTYGVPGDAGDDLDRSPDLELAYSSHLSFNL